MFKKRPILLMKSFEVKGRRPAAQIFLFGGLSAVLDITLNRPKSVIHVKDESRFIQRPVGRLMACPESPYHKRAILMKSPDETRLTRVGMTRGFAGTEHLICLLDQIVRKSERLLQKMADFLR